jgi:hypothetical protein
LAQSSFPGGAKTVVPADAGADFPVTGPLREQDWSMSQLVAMVWRKKPAEIQVSTDGER